MQIQLIDRGKVVKSGTIDCDDWDAVILEYEEAREMAESKGMWLNIVDKLAIPAELWGRFV